MCLSGIFVDDGIVTVEGAKSKNFFERVASLPGGTVFFAPLETSANGKVLVTKHRCRYASMNDISFDFRNGVMQNFKAATGGSCFEETMQPYTGPKQMFGTISIGLNPALRVLEEGSAGYRPEAAAGIVWVGLGNNRFFGGTNNTLGQFSFPITNATVTIDGKTVIRDGKLLL